MSSPELWNVAQLTERMKRHDERAWTEFHRRYYDRITAYVRVIVGKESGDVSDCVQQAFLRVVRHVRMFHEDEAFWNWLACLSRCATRDHLRGRNRRLRLLERWFHFQDGQNSVHPSETADLLIEKMQTLPEVDRQLIEGKYLRAESYRDLARLHGLTEKAVENRLGRIRARLRRSIEEDSSYVI